MPRTGMVAMSMSNQGFIHPSSWVDKKATRRTVQSFWPHDHGFIHNDKLERTPEKKYNLSKFGLKNRNFDFA